MQRAVRHAALLRYQQIATIRLSVQNAIRSNEVQTLLEKRTGQAYNEFRKFSHSFDSGPDRWSDGFRADLRDPRGTRVQDAAEPFDAAKARRSRSAAETVPNTAHEKLEKRAAC